MGHKNTQSYRT